ncbi:hypothetical protein HPB51_009370 [Rhipicephalus microplus]|uniref:HTH CENPB-type domain-containing protein n=1 Tax=Rhipicephalus microplus TaxID=6941 RepID=A0A9J6F065_RHIMP|nr:hypothetical protein HPB51_009370 [Rhipicephalus microplus]
MGRQNFERNLRNGTDVFSERVDNALFEYLECERSAGHAASNQIISEEAIKIANSMQLGNFVASSDHMNCWQQRFGVAMLRATKVSQKMPKKLSEAPSAFQSFANSLRLRNGHILYNMSNMDQTMVRIDNPTNKTNNMVGESTIRIANTGCFWQGFTACLATCTTSHKLLAIIVARSQAEKFHLWPL